MEQHQLIYMFLTLAMAIFTLGMCVVVYRKTRDPLVLAYLLVHLTFGLCVLGQFSIVYHNSSRFPAPSYLNDVNAYVQGFILPFLVIITLPRFIHNLFAIPDAQRRNTILFGVALCTYSIGQFFEFAVPDERLRHLHPGITSIVVSLVLLYSIIEGVRYYTTIQTPSRRLLARTVLILLGVTLPVMWIDLFRIVSLPLHPAVYTVMCFLIAHHFLAYDAPRPQLFPPAMPAPPAQAPQSTTDPVGERALTNVLTAEVYQRYNISPREQELVPLVLQGNSNQQIAETLFISLSTVKTHLRSIYAKFGVKNRYELIAFLQNCSRDIEAGSWRE